MIWVAGRIVPDDALRISVLDRTFEHGLGLFETLRTWNGQATLLSRHLDRLKRSAEELKLPLDVNALPTARAVADLLEAETRKGDALLRITLSGGLSETEGSTLWMRAGPLPPPSGPPWPMFRDVERTVASARPVDRGDRLARHKTLNYWAKRLAYDEARDRDEPESLSISTDQTVVVEGCRTNLFVVQEGGLLTPGANLPLLPGVMRGVVLEHARRLGLDVREVEDLTPAILSRADEVFLTNSVRGLVPIAGWGLHRFACPGPVTRRLRDAILPWLESGGDAG